MWEVVDEVKQLVGTGFFGDIPPHQESKVWKEEEEDPEVNGTVSFRQLIFPHTWRPPKAHISNKKAQELGRRHKHNTEINSETRFGFQFCLSALALEYPAITSNHIPKQSQEGPCSWEAQASWSNGPDHSGSGQRNEQHQVWGS